jgi:hypothetical protein
LAAPKPLNGKALDRLAVFVSRTTLSKVLTIAGVSLLGFPLGFVHESGAWKPTACLAGLGLLLVAGWLAYSTWRSGAWDHLQTLAIRPWGYIGCFAAISLPTLAVLAEMLQFSAMAIAALLLLVGIGRVLYEILGVWPRVSWRTWLGLTAILLWPFMMNWLWDVGHRY